MKKTYYIPTIEIIALELENSIAVLAASKDTQVGLPSIRRDKVF